MTMTPSRSTRRRAKSAWPPTEPLESEIQKAVLDHWKVAGTPGSLVAAIPNAGSMGQPGLTAGLFDLVVISSDLRECTGWLELKRESRRTEKDGGMSEAQIEFAEHLVQCGIPHAVAYGRDEPIEVLRRWGAIR